MEPAPIPHNEAERLAALHRLEILDTPPEADFDDFTRLASQICGTPIATISFIDAARQWFKSNIGAGASETPREISFCSHTILGSKVLEVPNTLEDERFRDSPFVTGATNVRFYAGAPLITPDGLNIGALCVIDKAPHHLTPEQREMLTILSRQVVHLLELRLAGRRIRWMNDNLEQLVVKRTEELQESEDRFRQLAEQSSEVFWFVGLNPERILHVSPAVEKVWGLTPERFRLYPRSWISSLHQDDGVRVQGAFEALLSGRSARFEMECRVIQPDRSMRWVVIVGTPIRDVDGGLIRIGGMAKDITERKRAEEGNADSLALLRATLDSTADGILTIGTDRQILSYNEAFVRMWHIPSELLSVRNDSLAIQCVLDQLQAPEQFLAKVYDLYEHPAAESFDVLEFKDGRVFERLSRPMMSKGHPAGRVWSFRDITERRHAERQITEQAAFLDKAQDAILNCDLDGKILFWNKGAERMYGLTKGEALGRKTADIICAAPEQFEEGFKTILEKGEFSNETEHMTKDRRKLIVEVRRTLIRDDDGRPKSVLAIMTDISGRKKIEAQFMRAQRMESLGTLAGGIAHDLNNSLAPIVMVAELLRMRYPNETKLIDTVESSAKRGASMVRQLLTFAKGADGERLLVHPQRLLNEMAKIIEGTFPKNIQLRTTYAKDLHAVLGDNTQLHQVLLNLCVNARDAMPNGGTLTLDAENREIDAAYARTIPDAKPGRYVVWRVTDTGSGIPPEVLEHLFEPFFSTKGPDKGTGLGLSTVIGIVKGHGGFIQIYSVPGEGSTFAVYLPADRPCDPYVSIPPFSGSNLQGQGETILVVDDEVNVRQAVETVLTSLNFRVVTAANASEALVQVSERRSEWRAVITDLHMPGIDGLTFTRMLKGMLPGVAIIIASGRLEESEKRHFRKLGITALLDKPFTQQKLQEALRSSSLVSAVTDDMEETERAEQPGDRGSVPVLAATK
jgi:two-component system, cell cycle sensor histidine kinase and response regulator CckA